MAESFYEEFSIQLESPLQHRHVLDLCAKLDKLFGAGYRFLPENLAEGGIGMARWPGRPREATDADRKTIEINVHNWPILSSKDGLAEFRTNPATALKPATDANHVAAAIFAGGCAPTWNAEELRKVKEALESLPCVASVTNFPAAAPSKGPPDSSRKSIGSNSSGGFLWQMNRPPLQNPT